MARREKFPTKFPGVRYYNSDDHPKYRGKPDRYYSIRLRVRGKLKEEGLGWASDGWTPEKANIELANLKAARTKGDGPHCLAEKRQFEQEKLAQKQAREKEARDKTRTFVDTWVQYWPEALINKKATSCSREEGLFRNWISPVIGNIPLIDIRPLHLERIKKNLKDKSRAPATIRYALAVIRQVFNFAKRNDLFKGDSPTSKVKFPSADNRRLRFLTPGEAQALLKELAVRNINVHDMALISLDCGLRRGEVFSLAWTDVDFTKDLITVRNTKSGRSRVAFTTSRVKARLQSRAATSDNGLVFPGKFDALVQALSRAFGSAVESLGLNDGIQDPRQRIVFHSLRHTFASRLAESGVSLYTIKEVLGHSTIAMTERYAHLSEKALRQTSEILEAYRLVEDSTQVEVQGLKSRS